LQAEYQKIVMPSQLSNGVNHIAPSLPPIASEQNSSQRVLSVTQNLHEIDTKKFLVDQINSDINRFRNADAFISAGLERLQGAQADHLLQRNA